MKLARRLRPFFCGLILLLALGRPQGANAGTTILPPAETCFSATTGISGYIGALGTITGGTLYTAGTYANVALTGGSGSGATANITVSGGAVTAVTILNPGTQYVTGDTLSAAAAIIGGTGSGFSVPVLSTAINSSLAGGTVAMYVPNTTTPKQTWQNSTQTVLNSNPITLNANGCAIIYGSGVYRQQLFDSLGNLIWDQLTTDTSASNSVFWAGLAGGTGNAITVSAPAFNNTDGSIINFTILSANSGPATLNAGTGAISIVKDTSTGPIVLSGGELQPTNIASLQYQLSTNEFHILNLVAASASTVQTPLCGFDTLKIVNDSIAPNSTVDVTANQALMQTTGGAYVTRNNVSTTVNLTLSGVAGGLDSRDTFSPSTFYNIFETDNGVAPASFASNASHGNAPSLPSGYTYKCRAGSIFTDASGNLGRIRQLGDTTQSILSTSETTALRALAVGTFGSTYVSTSTPTYATIVTQNVFVPPTATQIGILLANTYNNGSAAKVTVAPNPIYGGVNSISPACGFDTTSGAFNASQICWMILESANVYYAASANGGAAFVLGWRDSVNAH